MIYSDDLIEEVCLKMVCNTGEDDEGQRKKWKSKKAGNQDRDKNLTKDKG